MLVAASCFAAILAFAQAPAPHSSSVPPARLALLIGIDEYAADGSGKGPERLDGAKSDVEHVKRLLTGRFKFANEDVCMLLDQKATHEAIVRGFHDWLIERAGPATEVVIWFSGHGSRCPDAHPELSLEEGGLDSTLVACDSRAAGHAGGFDVTDKEIASLLRALGRKTERVTVVTDSCHSGGVTRGASGSRVRYAPDITQPLDWKEVAPFWPKEVEFRDDDRFERSEPLHYVHLAACANGEAAHEHEIALADGGRRVEGAFSHFLLEALDQLEPGTTYEQLLRRVGIRLGSLHRDQQAQGVGELDRIVFSADFAPPPPGFAATAAPEKRLVCVAAGSLHLLRKGSLLEIRDLDGKLLGQARVRQLEPVSSIAEWSGTPPLLQAETAVRAIEIERPKGPAPLRLLVQDDGVVQGMADEVVKRGKPEVELLRSAAGGVPLGLRRSADGPVVLVTEPDELELWRGSSERDAVASDELSSVLANELRYRELLALAEQPGTIPVSVSVTEVDSPAASQRRALLAKSAHHPAAKTCGTTRVVVDRSGEKNVLQLHVTIDRERRRRPAYVTILCVSEDRSVTLLFPDEGATDNLVEPGKALPVRINVFETRHAEGTRVPLDRILVFATERPADLRPYVQAGRFLPAVQPIEKLRGGEPLPDLLAEAFAPCEATRGAASASAIDVRQESFGIAALDLEVVAADPAPAESKPPK